MRFLYKILSRDYGILPSYKKEVRARLFIINSSVLLIIILLIFIIIYIIYFSDDIYLTTKIINR